MAAAAPAALAPVVNTRDKQTLAEIDLDLAGARVHCSDTLPYVVVSLNTRGEPHELQLPMEI